MEPKPPDASVQRETPALPPPAHPIRELPPPGTGDRGRPPSSPRRRLIWLLILALIGIGGVYWYLHRPPPQQPEQAGAKGRGGRGGRGGGGVPPVVAVKARKGDIGVYYSGLGAVTPINTVVVKSRVDGELLQVFFKEGDMVQKGQTLAEVDPRPFQAQLTQFEGQLARDEASLENARLDLKRYEILISQNAVAGQQLDTQRATVKQFEGAIKIDSGQIEGAKLNITYSHIIAPVTGRVGLRLVDPGNIIHASDPNGMLIITQISPISVIFTIGEDQLQDVVRRLYKGQNLPVDAWDREMLTRIAQGRLVTVDNQIDQTTGTVRLRATFDNANGALFPNQFINARLLVEMKHGVTLLPSAAIQRNSQMTYVYLVTPESTVTIRQINIGVSEGDDTEITSGLNPGDEIVITGVDKLQEGEKVVVHIEGERGPGGARGGRPGNQSQPNQGAGGPPGYEGSRGKRGASPNIPPDGGKKGAK